MIIGTAGHIDHGKTALVRRLTGVDTDRLPEEKKRGISIDLGFAPLVTPAGVRVGLVDVPGHERFVKNMLAGVGGIDLVLLVIAADEGVRLPVLHHQRAEIMRTGDNFLRVDRLDGPIAGHVFHPLAEQAEIGGLRRVDDVDEVQRDGVFRGQGFDALTIT